MIRSEDVVQQLYSLERLMEGNPPLYLPEDIASGEVYSQILWKSLLHRLNRDEQFLFSYISSQIQRGLREARRGALNLASLEFETLKQSSMWFSTRDELATLLRSYFSGAYAYLWHKQNLPHRAKQEINEAYQATLQLEIDYGYTFERLHRIQLGNNIARISLKSGEVLQALQTCVELAHHLLPLGNLEPSLPGPWDKEIVDSLDQTLVSASIVQLLIEISCVFLVESWSQGQRWRQQVDWGAECLGQVPHPCAFWLRAQHMLACANFQGFFHEAKSFFSCTSCNAELWYAMRHLVAETAFELAPFSSSKFIQRWMEQTLPISSMSMPFTEKLNRSQEKLIASMVNICKGE